MTWEGWWMIKEGFYFYKHNVYYGAYDEQQVSGWASISGIAPEYISTSQALGETDRAVRLWDNHRLLEPEYAALQAMLGKMQAFMPLNHGQMMDFSAVEERLQISLPKELKLIYTAISKQEIYFAGAEHFLPLEEIYVEQGMIVFFKKKRAPIAAYVIDTGCLAEYYKKEWHMERSGFCCYQFCVGRLLTIALENKPFFRKGRCKGKLVTTLDIEKELASFCAGPYHLLTEFGAYGIAILYSDEKLIAWIRSNGFYADIHAGALKEEHLDALARHLGDIVWQ